MLFFGGFGSILPYLLYLSVVWICILLGVKGNIRNLVEADSAAEEIFISDGQSNYLTDSYVVTIFENTPTHVLQRLQDFSSIPAEYLYVVQTRLLRWVFVKSKWKPASKVSSANLRGPPQLIC